MNLKAPAKLPQADDARALAFFFEHQSSIFRRTDRLFAVLLPLQWLAAIFVAYFISPQLWSQNPLETPNNVRLAFIFGGLIIAVPTLLTLVLPGETITRYAVAVAQMLLSALLIHLSGGRVETHFHIFGSLAFLSFYRDWKILIPATLVTALDHIFRGYYYPLSIYGSVSGNEWRWAEHLGWTLFEVTVLIISIQKTVFKMWQNSFRNAAVEAKEEKYRAVVEQTDNGIALIEPENLQVIECNEAFSRLLGCSSIDEAKNYKAKNLECQNDWLQRNRLLDIHTSQSSFVSTDKKIRQRDGTEIPVETTVNLISYAGRRVFCVNLKDITERKHAEAEIARLAIVAQKTQNAVLITDTDGIIRWVNRGFSSLTDYDYDEAVGRSGYFLLGEKTDKSAAETIKTAIQTQNPFSGEVYGYGKNGKEFWISISITPWRDERDEFQGFVSILTDITERKIIEEELRRAQDELENRVAQRTAELSEAQQFLRKVVDSVPNLIFVKDSQRRYKLANKAVAEFHGTTIENLIGNTFTDFSSEKNVIENIADDESKLIENLTEATSREEKFTDAQGNSRWMHAVKVPMEISGDNSRYILGIVTDLTERKELENRLRHSQKMESIGQLAAGIAHEINTPTQYVSDNTLFVRDSFSSIKELLEKYNELLNVAKVTNLDRKLVTEIEDRIERCDLDFLLEEVPQAVEQSLEGVLRISKIVQSMRTFAHPGAMEKQPTDINKAIESTVLVAHNEWKYVAELETAYDATLPLVPCLLDEFNRVILNMVINATHSISEVVGKDPRVRGKLTIKTKRIGDEWVEIQISDTGTGIPPEVQNRIFDPFFTTKEVGKGTGQGLAISHNVIVEKHGGEITFETERGFGTTFSIRLPLKTEELPDEEFVIV